ncbi:transposable element Tcb2 transposase [Trichonephila clavipes]|nr:transposable element Tcb2 transposase [Trichonephila clavipes]
MCRWRDTGPSIRLITTLTGDWYVSIISYYLLPFKSIAHSKGLGEFQLYNERPHTSRIATEWLQEQSSEFRHCCWPPKSPNMNIIEYIWDVLQRSVQFMDIPAGFMVSVTFSTTSDINRIHATLCCGTSACSWGPYMILIRCTNFFGSSVYKSIYIS